MFSWVKTYFSVSSSVVSDNGGGGDGGGEGGNRVEDKEEEEVEEETPLDDPIDPLDAILPSDSSVDKEFLDGTPDPKGSHKPEKPDDSDPVDSGDESADSHRLRNPKSSSSRAA